MFACCCAGGSQRHVVELQSVCWHDSMRRIVARQSCFRLCSSAASHCSSLCVSIGLPPCACTAHACAVRTHARAKPRSAIPALHADTTTLHAPRRPSAASATPRPSRTSSSSPCTRRCWRASARRSRPRRTASCPALRRLRRPARRCAPYCHLGARQSCICRCQHVSGLQSCRHNSVEHRASDLSRSAEWSAARM